ncbi:MAG: hypothetical protein HYZ43_03595 [Flavobacteriia bacterium]|nr:hypothetical protein [Flavobacteriia bacterium]
MHFQTIENDFTEAAMAKMEREFNRIIQGLYSDQQVKLVSKINSHHPLTFIYYEDRLACLVVYKNSSLVYENKPAWCIGNFECENDPELSNTLFEQAFNIAKEHHIQQLIGPMNGSSWDAYRYSLNHDVPNFFLEPYHHLYYHSLWQNQGFTSIANYYSHLVTDLHIYLPEREERLQNWLNKEGITIRGIDLENYEAEIKKVYEFCSIAFKNNFLYTPISWELFYEKYKPLKPFADADLILLAEDLNKNVVAILFSIKDYYNKSTPTLIIKTIARLSERRYAGVTHLMSNQLIRTAISKGYTQMIHAFMHQDNKSTNVSSHYSGEPLSEYVLYVKQF